MLCFKAVTKMKFDINVS